MYRCWCHRAILHKTKRFIVKLSWHVKLSFKFTNIICVNRMKYFFFSLLLLTTVHIFRIRSFFTMTFLHLSELWVFGITSVNFKVYLLCCFPWYTLLRVRTMRINLRVKKILLLYVCGCCCKHGTQWRIQRKKGIFFYVF